VIRKIRTVKLQQRPDTGQFYLTIPQWIIKKVILAKKGDRLEWDFQGEEALIRKKSDDT